MAVACNNLVVLKRNKEFSDSLRKLDSLFDKKTSEEGLRFAEGLEHRLSTRQKEAIAFNRFLLLLLGNKLDQVCHNQLQFLHRISDIVCWIFSYNLRVMALFQILTAL